MRGGGRPRVSKAPSSSAFDPMAAGGRRDSDASSLCSSRPSSAGGRNPNPNAGALLADRSSQASALRAVNAYLSAHSAPFSLRPPLPSARDITDALRFLLARLDFPLSPSDHLDDDLLPLLKHLGCPVKISRSALKAPGTPHSWPALVSLLYWLLQLARYADHHHHHRDSSSENKHGNDILAYVSHSYALYISGNDAAVDELDQEYLAKAQHQADNAAASVDALAKEAADLEARLLKLQSQPSRKEALESERNTLAEDVKKFEAVVESWKGQVANMEGKLKEWEGELEAKEWETKRVSEENEALKKKIEGQAVGVRDAERMTKEMQSVERDAAEAEVGRNAMEDKAWELEADIGRKLKDLQALADECNQALRK